VIFNNFELVKKWRKMLNGWEFRIHLQLEFS
jgi:hypothetical protein